MTKAVRTLQILWLLIAAFQTTLLADEGYEIYPRPQKIEYKGGSFRITSTVNVVLGRGIDAYTKKRVEEILKSKKLNITYSRGLAGGKTNFLVGINRTGDSVDKYFEKRVNHDESFFNKIDAHIVSVDNNVIAVLGKDPDSAFYGVTTLKHVFNQLQSGAIREFRADDFAHVKHRGFIEGYYGNPWSNEDRADLMHFGGDYKLNTYFFAPKDDKYHNSKWRVLYPPKELAEIRKLAQAGNESKCKYVYALHTFMHSPVRFDTDANYEADLKIIKAKFNQLLENDVRAFSILADDAGVPPQGPQTYVRLLNDLTNWLIQLQKTKYPDLVTDIPFCPNDYMGNGGSPQLKELNKAPYSCAIIMTGGRIWGEVSEGFTSNFIKNIESPGRKGRPSYLWINWPCSDNSKDHLIMGGNDTFLHPGVTPENIGGIILNPMQQAEANKSALFAVADYSWNIWDDKAQADQNWHDSFKYMNHGTAQETQSSSALREICKHMINQAMDGRVRALQESLDLAPKLNAFLEKQEKGTFKKGDSAELIAEFTKLQKAAAFYKENPGNPRTRDQIVYWLDCWQDTTTAAISYLQCAEAILANDTDKIWTYYSTGKLAFDKSRTHQFWYLNHWRNAEAGVQHIVPFIKTMGEKISPIAAKIISSNIGANKANATFAVYSNVRNPLKVDGKLSVAKLPATSGISLKPGEYLGIRLDRIKDLKSIDVDTNTSALALQSSPNAVEWQAVRTGKISPGRYIRLLNNSRGTVNFDLKKFEVHSNEIEPITLVRSFAKPHKDADPTLAFDGDFNTKVPFAGGLSNGSEIVYDLGQTLPIDNLKVVVLDTEIDHIRDAKFQLSLDGQNWQDAFETKRKTESSDAKPQDNGYTHGSLSKGVIPISHSYLEGAKLNTKARYFRILGTQGYGARWVSIAEVLINNGEYIPPVNNPTYVSKPLEKRDFSPENLMDGDLTTAYQPNTQDGRIKRGYLTYSLSDETRVKKLTIVQDGNNISNARVMARTVRNKWVPLGFLKKSLNKFNTGKLPHIFELRIDWKGKAPTLYEIITD